LKHIFENDWIISGYNETNFILCDRLYSWCKAKKITPIAINIDQIAAKPFETGYCTIRYENADISLPGIVSKMPNPMNKTYRLIDGRHRLLKLSNLNFDTMLFYDIPINVIYRFIL
jgi:hypothetical protein